MKLTGFEGEGSLPLSFTVKADSLLHGHFVFGPGYPGNPGNPGGPGKTEKIQEEGQSIC